MGVVNDPADQFICEICLNNYDSLSRKPYSFYPCGHTFCIDCMNKMKANTCPTCRTPFQSKIPNWEILKRLNGGSGLSAPSAPPATMPQQVNLNLLNVNPTREAANSLEHFFNMSCKRKFMCFYSVFLTFLAMIYPSALIHVSLGHLRECNVDERIPIWMLTYGCLGIVMCIAMLLLIQYLFLTPKGGRGTCAMTTLTISVSTAVLFEFCWFLAGCVFVFSAYDEVTYDPYNLKQTATYCQPNLYKFAFGTLVTQCILFGIFICITPCLLCCLPWKKCNEI